MEGLALMYSQDCLQILPSSTRLVDAGEYSPECFLKRGHRGQHLVQLRNGKFVSWQPDDQCGCREEGCDCCVYTADLELAEVEQMIERANMMLSYNDLTLQQFGYLLLSFLAGHYSRSGVSGPRTLRGMMLDAILFPVFMREKDFIDFLPDQGWRDHEWLVEKTRKVLKRQQAVQLELFRELPNISLHQYTCLVLSEMCAWYAEDAKRIDPLCLEKEIVDLVFLCFGGLFICRSFQESQVVYSLADLLKEGKSRYYRRLDDYFSFGPLVV